MLLCQVFFHGAGQFQYYTEQETMPNSFRIDFLTLKVAEHAGLRYKIDYDWERSNFEGGLRDNLDGEEKFVQLSRQTTRSAMPGKKEYVPKVFGGKS